MRWICASMSEFSAWILIFVSVVSRVHVARVRSLISENKES